MIMIDKRDPWPTEGAAAATLDQFIGDLDVEVKGKRIKLCSVSRWTECRKGHGYAESSGH